MRGKQSTEVQAETGEAAAATAEPEAPQGCAGTEAAPQHIWASRSSKSIRQEEALQKELARCNALKRRAEGTLSGLTEDKARALRLIKEGESWADAFLSKTLGNIENEQRKLATFEEIAAKAQSNLDNFRAGVAAYAPERARVQNNLATFAACRLEIDYELEKLLRQALRMLQVREETIACMRKEAAAIELESSFEAGVPASLHEALSLEIVCASKAWNAEFCGENENLRPYVVCDENFEPKETLARKALYHFGETIFLLEDEAREFLRDDRSKAGGFEWETLPASLMTPEAFAAARAECKLPGGLLSYFLRQKHDELQQKRREACLLERRGTPVPGIGLHFAG
jgi:hypothetical protein